MTNLIEKYYSEDFFFKVESKRTYTSEVKAEIARCLSENIRRGVAPNKEACVEAIQNSTMLKGYEWRTVKYLCHNIIQKKKKGKCFPSMGQ